MKKISIILSIFALYLIISCENSTQIKISNFDELNAKHWELVSYKTTAGEIIFIDDIITYSKKFYLNFYKDTLCYGRSGCNTYSGNYSVEEDKISFSSLFSTLVNCELTGEYSSSLMQSTNWRYNNYVFTLISTPSATMTEMYFKEIFFNTLVISDDFIMIDIDTDGFLDFSIYEMELILENGDLIGKAITFSSSKNEFSYGPVNDNAIINNDIYFFQYISTLASKNNNDGVWDEFWQGNFVADEGLFLAIKLNIANDYYFGWIELNVDKESGEVKIWDMAFQNTSGKQIRAGEKP